MGRGGGDFVGKPERNRPSERYRRPWEDNIKIEIKRVMGRTFYVFGGGDFVGKPERNRQSQSIGVHGRIILRWILNT
jgi:hypothetical protein